MLDSEEEQAKLGQEFVDIVTKEIEPLLKDAKPFFGGSQKVTLAEVSKSGRGLRATLIYCRL
jgi:glutathione S-transferase